MARADAVLQIEPIGHPLDATVRVPGSKSVTNRALVLAALAAGVTRLRRAAVCDDSEQLIAALRALGFAIETARPQEDGGAEAGVVVTGGGGRIPARNASLHAGSAGTATRFLTALACLGHGHYVIDGSERMRERPMHDLVAALGRLGARISSHKGGLPLSIDAGGLEGGTASVSGEVSSQFLSALMMAAPYARTPVDLEVHGPLSSRPYVDLTVAMMEEFGVGVVCEGESRFRVPCGQYTPQPDYVVEPDASAASYMFAAAAIVGGRVRVLGITPRCKQGDIGFLEVLKNIGCNVREGPGWTEVAALGDLQGVNADLRDMPDLAQTLAVIAPFATSPTVIRGIASARRKECDRIAAVCAELSRLGVSVTEHGDGMTIHPCMAWRRSQDSACSARSADLDPAGFAPSADPASVCSTLSADPDFARSAGPVRTYNDHRMAMAFALVGLRVPGIAVQDPACVAKSYPGYFETIETLRGESQR
jgi:3-phosphoshikimate 1-carboxyvinyltransferase